MCKLTYNTGITDEEGQSPLTCVLSNMNEVILEEETDLILYLLEHGCDSSEETTKLLCVACSYGNLTLVKTLVEQFSIDPKGNTTFQAYCKMNA